MILSATVGSEAADIRVAISINPATGLEHGRYPMLDAGGCEAVVAASAQAYQQWRRIPLSGRSAAFDRLGAVLRTESERLARGITAEMGKPITQARAEVRKCAGLCDWYATNAERLLAPETVDVDDDGTARIEQRPIGTVLAVMPWNFPLWQVLRAAVPIMIAGNGFLLKHADNVQGSAAALAQAFEAADFPSGLFGVLNIDRDALPALIADRRVAAVTVTAGVSAGAAIAAEAGRNLKKSVLELGGSDPFIVLADANLDRAVPAAVSARFQNSGQVCIAAKRLIVERPIADEFTRRFIEAASRLRVGDPAEDETELGPLARTRLRAELHAQVEASVARGAHCLLGGAIPEGAGAYYPPTILTDVTPDMPVFREETFGPVASIIVAESAEHAVQIANDSDFGLSGALWSSDVERATRLAGSIETGGVFINGIAASDPRVPIGGIKQSGFGRELSYFGLREFCNAQLIWSRS